jgi:DNA-binding Lrp family transcriptional regulator
LSEDITVFLNLFVESKELSKVTDALVKLPEVVDAYEVTGEYDVVATLHVENIQAFRELLKDKILKIEGVKSTVSSVVLHAYNQGTDTAQ